MDPQNSPAGVGYPAAFKGFASDPETGASARELLRDHVFVSSEKGFLWFQKMPDGPKGAVRTRMFLSLRDPTPKVRNNI